MEVFKLTLNQMLELFLFMLVGFLLKKRNIFPDNFSTILSKLEMLVFLPAMIINSFLTNCTISNLLTYSKMLVVCTGYLVIMTLIATPLSKLFSKKVLERNCFKYSLIIPNSGYVGMPVVLGVFGSEALFQYLMFTIPVNIFVYTVCVLWLTTSGEKFQWKNLLNPVMISLVIGIVLGLTQLQLPTFVTQSLELAGGCMAPVGMIITGYVIGQYDIGKLFANVRVLILSILRLIVIPLTFFLPMKYLLHFDQSTLIMVMAYTAMPLGMNTILLPASNGEDTTAGASMTLISNLMAIVTIPLMFMLL